MKKAFLFTLLSLCATLYSEEWQNEFAAESYFLSEPETKAQMVGAFPSLCGLPSFNIDGIFIDVSKTDFRSEQFEDQSLKYREVDLNFSYLFPFNSRNGLVIGAGYTGSLLDWPENPFFEETHFHYVTFSAAALTQCADNWLWKAGGMILLDTAELSLSQYTLYQVFLLGKYALCQPLMLNAGFILELGLSKGKIWPTLGFDYYYSERLNFHAVFPLDISAEYYLLKGVSIEGSMRFLRNRHRVKNNDPIPMGIFEYETAGLEVDLNIIPSKHCLITGFVGSTFNGDIKMTDRNNHHAVHAKFNGSLYGGVSANINY